jgi:hypothetical protein
MPSSAPSAVAAVSRTIDGHSAQMMLAILNSSSTTSSAAKFTKVKCNISILMQGHRNMKSARSTTHHLLAANESTLDARV